MSKRLATISTDVPIEFSLEAVKAREPDEALLKSALQGAGVFQPAQGTGSQRGYSRARLSRAADSRRRAGVAGRHSRRVLLRAVAISPIARGRVRARHHRPGLRGRTRRAPSTPKIWRCSSRGWRTRARPKIACDVKSALLTLGRMGIEARGFEHDVMLYAFLLDADPSGCPLEEQARRRFDLKLGASPEQHADITLELFQQLSPAVDARGLRKLYSEHRAAAGARAGAHGAHRHPHRPIANCAACRP